MVFPLTVYERVIMKPVEIVEVETSNVSCDGGSVLGHPRIYLNMGETKEVDCPYCGCRFVLKKGVNPELNGHN